MVAFEDFLRIFCKENAVDGDAAGSFLIGQEFCPDSLKEIKARKFCSRNFQKFIIFQCPKDKKIFM